MGQYWLKPTNINKQFQKIEDKDKILKPSRKTNTAFIHMAKIRKAINIDRAMLKERRQKNNSFIIVWKLLLI